MHTVSKKKGRKRKSVIFKLWGAEKTVIRQPMYPFKAPQTCCYSRLYPQMAAMDTLVNEHSFQYCLFQHVPALLILLRSLSWYGLWSCDRATAFPSLSHNTPRESPTLATVSSLSDSSATKHVVPVQKIKRKIHISSVYMLCILQRLLKIVIFAYKVLGRLSCFIWTSSEKGTQKNNNQLSSS